MSTITLLRNLIAVSLTGHRLNNVNKSQFAFFSFLAVWQQSFLVSPESFCDSFSQTFSPLTSLISSSTDLICVDGCPE